MRHRFLALLTLAAVALPLTAAKAQHHGGRAAPATAPPSSTSAQAQRARAAAATPAPTQAAAPQGPFLPVSSGLGPIQFLQTNYGVPAPQTLARQLHYDDDRTRMSALSALGVPGMYLQKGHIPYPHTVTLQMVALGASDDLDALLTVEMDDHVVTAILVPVDDNWHRVATLIFATPYYVPAPTAAASWLHVARSMQQPDRYRAVFHASTGSLDAPNFNEYEGQIRVFNGRPVVIISFESIARDCAVSPPPSAAPVAASEPRSSLKSEGKAEAKSTCTLVHRWFQVDRSDPGKRFQLVTATGHIPPHDLNNQFSDVRSFLDTHLHTFSCQPFLYSEASLRYEPVGPSGACSTAK